MTSLPTKTSPSIMGGGRMNNQFVRKSIKRGVTNTSPPSIIREGMIMSVMRFELTKTEVLS